MIRMLLTLALSAALLTATAADRRFVSLARKKEARTKARASALQIATRRRQLAFLKAPGRPALSGSLASVATFCASVVRSLPWATAASNCLRP